MAGMTTAEKSLVRCGKKYTVMAQLWAPSFETLSQSLVEDSEYESLNQSEQTDQDLIREFVGILPPSEQENYQDGGNWNHVS